MPQMIDTLYPDRRRRKDSDSNSSSRPMDRLRRVKEHRSAVQFLGVCARYGYNRTMVIRDAYLAPAEHHDPIRQHSKDLGVSTIVGMEGFMKPQQAKWFRDLLSNNPQIKNIAEIGFNGGHSATNFLGVRPDIELTSFDIAEHGYVKKGKEIIDKKYPGRHSLVLGDSTSTIPSFSRINTKKFDLVFIDGGHDLDTAYKDIVNCRGISEQGGLVVVDDCSPGLAYGIGPEQAYNQAVSEGLINHHSLNTDGDRAWAFGSYQ